MTTAEIIRSTGCCDDPMPYYNAGHWRTGALSRLGICCTCGAVLFGPEHSEIRVVPGDWMPLIARRRPDLYHELCDYSRATRIGNTQLTLAPARLARFALDLDRLSTRPLAGSPSRGPACRPFASAFLRRIRRFAVCILRFATWLNRYRTQRLTDGNGADRLTREVAP